MKIKTARLDPAKTAIQMHGAAGRGKAMLKKQLEREQVLTFGLPPIHHQDAQRIEAHVFHRLPELLTCMPRWRKI